ncbi:MAG: hypothetical protein QOH46_3752, partial [Solirubrobacteraceae bacterium]|nr:hypothetical protein [Solirubrobacteraceae bacterium]
WEVTVDHEPMAAATTADVDLVEIVRRRMLEAGWDLVICLTDSPVLIGRRPVVAHASVAHGVGLISVPALGAVALETRLRTAVLRLVERLLGEERRGRRPHERRRRHARMRGRLDELASPIGEVQAQEGGTIRFVTEVVRGNLRLLVGMVRANRPWRVVVGLSRALIAALGAGAFGIVSPGVWLVADGLGWARIVAVCVASVVVTCIALMTVHRLWERSPSPAARERVTLFNLATTLTVAVGVVTQFVALLAIAAVCMVAVVAPGVLRDQLGRPVDAAVYLKVALLISTLATIGGALGAALESDRAVRTAAYGYRADED